MFSEPLEPGTAFASSRKRPNHYLRSPRGGVEFVMFACLNSIPLDRIMNPDGESVNVVIVERPTGESPRIRDGPRCLGVRTRKRSARVGNTEGKRPEESPRG